MSPTLCDPMDYTVPGILQARILVWVAFPFSRGSSQPGESNPGLLNYRQILYQLSYKESRGWGPLFKTMHGNQILALIDWKRHC